MHNVPQLVAALRDASCFEDAALALLGMLLGIASESLAASRYARRGGGVLRAVLHMRPDGAYRRLFILSTEVASASPAELSGMGARESDTFWASASAWRAIAEHRSPISIDVSAGELLVHSVGSVDSAGLSRAPFASHESAQRFLGRQASHVHILPLLARGASVEGIVAIEADCMAAVGQGFIWEACTESLRLLTDIAAPYLLHLPSRPGNRPQPDELLPVIGSAMAAMVPILSVFAQQDETILISGPTGAGKSRLARWCHARSPRRDRHFEILDLLTIPEELQMAELFGWRKGAFTGAVRENPGSVARAEGGTLFIDEIDKLSLRAQAGLLHLLEERAYRVLGDGASQHRADVRFIVGTNADLRAEVRAGRFREDLYYRINILPVRIPSLVERWDEIPAWAEYMLARRHGERQTNGSQRVSPEAQRLLLATPWPGNLRQLDNIIRRAYAITVASHGGAARDMVLEEAHLLSALAYEAAPERRSLTEAMQAAAAEFVRTAQRLPDGLDLDHAEAFRGFVLGSAIQQVGRVEAFHLLRRETLVKNRNHHKALKRDLERVDAILRAVGEQPSPFAALQDTEPTDD